MPAMPLPSDDERTLLLAFLDSQRYGLKNAAYGLSDSQAAEAASASTLTVGGLIKHLTAMERGWAAKIGGERSDGGAADRADAYADGFRIAPGESLASLIDDYDAAAKDTNALIESTSLDRAVPVPKGVPWFPADVESWSVRWVVLHLIEETARHAGHADLVREAVDGATATPLLAAVEGWPATDWMQPWSPSATV